MPPPPSNISILEGCQIHRTEGGGWRLEDQGQNTEQQLGSWWAGPCWTMLDLVTQDGGGEEKAPIVSPSSPPVACLFPSLVEPGSKSPGRVPQ